MTKEFEEVRFDPQACRKETEEFQAWLAANPSLDENKDILPFFRERKQLSAFIGSYHPDIVHYDPVAHELPLFGDFICDLVVGDSKRQAYAFIEFEDGKPDSIFVKRKNRLTPEWSPRFEHGFSQLVDWFCKLDDQKDKVDFEELFGKRNISHIGLLIIGRAEQLGAREDHRLRWRQGHVLVNSKPIHCKTFDQLCEDILHRLDQFRLATRAEEKKSTGEAAKQAAPATPTPQPDPSQSAPDQPGEPPPTAPPAQPAEGDPTG